MKTVIQASNHLKYRKSKLILSKEYAKRDLLNPDDNIGYKIRICCWGFEATILYTVFLNSRVDFWIKIMSWFVLKTKIVKQSWFWRRAIQQKCCSSLNQVQEKHSFLKKLIGTVQYTPIHMLPFHQISSHVCVKKDDSKELLSSIAEDSETHPTQNCFPFAIILDNFTCCPFFNDTFLYNFPIFLFMQDMDSAI